MLAVSGFREVKSTLRFEKQVDIEKSKPFFEETVYNHQLFPYKTIQNLSTK
jgi:hypothetical protein